MELLVLIGKGGVGWSGLGSPYLLPTYHAHCKPLGAVSVPPAADAVGAM